MGEIALTEESYRERLNRNIVYAENEDVETEREFLLPENVNDILDSIETDVNVILEKLDQIEGLVEIDEVKELVQELASELY